MMFLRRFWCFIDSSGFPLLIQLRADEAIPELLLKGFVTGYKPILLFVNGPHF